MTGQGFLQRLRAGEILISDGATGSSLLQSGLKQGESAEGWVLEKPEEICRLAKSFVAAGADIILTCTFGGTRLRLQASGLGAQAEAINREAVAIARHAVEGTAVLVAGSIGPTGQMLKPFGTITQEEAQASYAEQASCLHQAGVDLLVIETQFDIDEATAAVCGVRSVSDLPLVCSFSYDRGRRTMMGVSPAQMAEIFGVMDVDLLGINCGRSLDENLAALQQLHQVTDKPIWFKPNAGLPSLGEAGRPVYAVSPDEMAAAVPAWIAAGASVIGGCCGTSPEHLGRIADAVKNFNSQAHAG